MKAENEILSNKLDDLQIKYSSISHLEPNFSENFDNESVLDKQYFLNAKIIKEKFDQLSERVDKIYRTRITDLAADFQEKLMKLKQKRTVSNLEEDFVSVSELNQMSKEWEDKLKNLISELQEKENYILLAEQKYEMACEENGFIKRKVENEKVEIMKQLNKLQNELETKVFSQCLMMEQSLVGQVETLDKKVESQLRMAVESVQGNFNEQNKRGLEEEINRLKAELIKKSSSSTLESDYLKSCDEITKLNLLLNKQSKEISEIQKARQILEDKYKQENEKNSFKAKKFETTNELIEHREKEIFSLKEQLKCVITEKDITKLLESITEDAYLFNENKTNLKPFELLAFYLKKTKDECDFLSSN